MRVVISSSVIQYKHIILHHYSRIRLNRCWSAQNRWRLANSKNTTSIVTAHHTEQTRFTKSNVYTIFRHCANELNETEDRISRFFRGDGSLYSSPISLILVEQLLIVKLGTRDLFNLVPWGGGELPCDGLNTEHGTHSMGSGYWVAHN